MEINITRFFKEAEPFEFSASIAERGPNAGPETWANAVREGADAPLLRTRKQIEAGRKFFAEFGAWDDKEVAGWSAAEINALFIQYISGDIRELESLCIDDDGEIDWDRYEELSREGSINGNMFKGTDGRIYYDISN